MNYIVQITLIIWNSLTWYYCMHLYIWTLGFKCLINIIDLLQWERNIVMMVLPLDVGLCIVFFFFFSGLNKLLHNRKY